MKKASVWPIVVTTLLIPIIYVASFGPVCWAMGAAGQHESEVFNRTYWPIGWLSARGATFLTNYGALGLPPNYLMSLSRRVSHNQDVVFGRRQDGKVLFSR